MQNNYDVVVIGSGPGGYVAAIRCAQHGKKVAIIEKENLGGVCLNWGCIPTKALLRTAEIKHIIDHASDFGISVENVKVDFKKIIERSRSVANQLSGGISHLMKKNKITVINGHAKFLNKNKVEVKDADKTQVIEAKSFIIATGATSRTIDGLDINHKRVWNAKKAMTADFFPKSLLIVGAGAIGIEFASFYQALGCNVHVLEMQKNILPQEDIEISEIAKKQFEKHGIKFLTESKTKTINVNDKSVDAVIVDALGKESKFSFDAVIVAVGVVGNTGGLGLENTKVEVVKNQISTNDYCQTKEENIYAIGDVAGAPWLAHKASHEGIIVADHISSAKTHVMNKTNIPGCTYSIPQIASLGLSEVAAKAKNIDIKVGRFPFMANGKAVSHGKNDGLIKTIFDAKTGEIVGIHMVGADVSELVSTFCVAKSAELTEEDIINTIFPHPTLSEMMHEATLDACKRVIHF